jgi:hypothetical protein
MKLSKNIMTFVAVLTCVFGLTFSTAAQKRKTSVKKTRTSTTGTTAAPGGEIKSGAQKVSTQLKNVSKFIYILGGVAQGIEDVDKDIRTGKVSQATVDQNAKNKQAVVRTIGNLRAGLANLEVEFRTKPALKNYLAQIQGITDMSGRAEDQAAAGQLTDSGKTLLLVVEKLSDTLAALP